MEGIFDFELQVYCWSAFWDPQNNLIFFIFFLGLKHLIHLKRDSLRWVAHVSRARQGVFFPFRCRPCTAAEPWKPLMALYLWWKAQANYFTPPPESHQKICHITLDDYDFFITWGYLYAMATRGTMHQWNSWRAHGGWTASSTWITLHIFTHLQFTSSYVLWNQHFNGLFQKLQGLRGLISFNMCWFLDERAAVFLDTTNCCRCLQHDSQHTHWDIKMAQFMNVVSLAWVSGHLLLQRHCS